jgi:pimeloyl-ACP methyl ester carboxylesterase
MLSPMDDRAPTEARAATPWTATGRLDAPGIVFIHGTRLTRSQWAPQVRLLSGRFRCVSVDLPGHGALAAEPFTLAGAVAVVAAAIEAEVPSGRALLVGLSLGGYVAIDTAEAHPERVAGLVLAGCSAEAFGPMTWPFRGFATVMERTPRLLLGLMNRSFFRLRYPRSVAEPIIEGGFWPVAGAVAARLLIGRRYLDRLGGLWTRVLVINGTLDPVFGPQGEYWAASCRDGRHVRLPHAMHLSNLDRPRTFANHVAAFMERIDRDA